MFFKNQKPHQFTFSERVGALKPFGFAVSESGGKATVTRRGCGAVLDRVEHFAQSIADAIKGELG